MKNVRKILKDFGLDDKETKVYLALLELGETGIERISKKSEVKRTTVYDIISSLKAKGLVATYISRKKKYYYAESPEIILENAEKNLENLKSSLPELLAMANMFDVKPKMRFYEGINGMKTVYMDTLKVPNSEICIWSAQDIFTEFDIKFIFDTYVPKRVKNNIFSKGILANTEDMQKVKDADKENLRETRLVKENLPFEVELQLYGNNKIGVVSFKEKFGLIIESEKLHNTLKSIFTICWNSLK